MNFIHKIFRYFVFFYILHFSFYNLKCYCQSYTPFPDSNAVWVIKYLTYDNGSEYYYYLPKANADTIITSKKYSKILTGNGMYGYPDMYYGAIRQDSAGKVFVVYTGSVNELLLYDFSADLNDTVEFWRDPYTSYIVIVDNIDSVIIGNQYRKRLCIRISGGMGQCSFVESNWDLDHWIEGVGGSGGLFETDGSFPSEYVYYLKCMSFNDTIFWYHVNYWDTVISYYPGNCIDSLDTIVHIKTRNDVYEFSIYSVYGTNLIKMNFGSYSNQIMNISLIDLPGRVVKGVEISNQSDYILDLSGLNDGLYFLIIRNELYYILTTKIVKIRH